ncbi:MAG: ATP-binding cassette domain-containing protein [Candidatus Zixiibacteriota bacterium]
MNVIDVQDLTKIYQRGMRKRGIVALDNVTFSVQQGEVIGLLGPNGAGKTTFLKVLLGITRPTTGTIIIAGLSPTDPMSRQKIGYLPENHRFPGYLTGLGFLKFAGRLYGLMHEELDERAGRLLELVGMDKWAGTKLKKYSKGMSQRIGLAQALMCDPEILLLDEPTDGVDPVGKVEIRRVLEKIRGEGKTIVLSSHLLAEVETIADRVAILSKGRLLRVSTVEELTIRDNLFEIQAEIGSIIVKIPPKMGRILSITSKRLIVKLANEDDINYLIDQLRMKRITIRSIRPVKASLEQSFIETLGAVTEEVT